MGNDYIESKIESGILTQRHHVTNSNITTSSLSDIRCGSIVDVSRFTDKHADERTDTDKNVKHKQPVPDGGYGWVVVAAAFCNFALLGGHFMGFSLLYSPIRERYDASYATVGWVGSVSQAMTHIPGFIYGTIVVKKGCRLTCMVGGVLASSGALLSAFAPSVYVLYITYGLLSGCGMGLIFISNVVIVQQYFDRRRGLASAVSMAGISFGVVAGAWLLHFCLTKYGWTGTMLIVGGLYLHAVVGGALHRPVHTATPPSTDHSSLKPQHPSTCPHRSMQKAEFEPLSMLSMQDPLNQNDMKIPENKYCKHAHTSNPHELIDPPVPVRYSDSDTNKRSYSNENPGEPLLDSKPRNQPPQEVPTTWLSEIFDFSLLRHPKFVIYCTATMLMNFGMLAFYMHSPSRALELGIPTHLVAFMPQAIGIGTFVSRVLSGFVADSPCVSRILLYSIGILLGSVAEITFIFSTTFPPILVHCVVFGVCNGIFLSVQSTVLVDLLSVARIARSQALFSCFIGLTCLLVTPTAGLLYDVTGNYDIPFLVTGCMQLIAGLALTALSLSIICAETDKK